MMKNGFRFLVLPFALLMMLAMTPGSAKAGADGSGQAVVSRDFWSHDAAIIGNGRKHILAEGEVPHGFKCDYNITIPQTGWYALYLRGAQAGFRHDVFVDGKATYYHGETDSKTGKARNLWLEAGDHVLRVQRVGRTSHPRRIFDRLELVPSSGRPEEAITASKTLVDVMRLGETFKIEVTGGGDGQGARYELIQHDARRNGAAAPVAVGTVIFPADDKPITQVVEIPCKTAGVFRLTAKAADGDEMPQSAFPIGSFVVVDVSRPKPASGELELLYEIDCVEQTINGEPIASDDFFECNGPTRISETSAGRYRESHDCTPPLAATPATPVKIPASYSGFSYRITVPDVQVPYVVEVIFPDDARRSVSISLNWVEQDNQPSKASYYTGKSYETGGMFPISQQMRKHSAVSWAKTRTLLLAALSQEVGKRAAVAKIRVSRFKDDRLPAAPQGEQTPGGRDVIHWYEESKSWHFLVGVAGVYHGTEHDYIGLDRWAQLVRYHGFNGITGFGVGYQSAFWRNTALEGFSSENYDASRLLLLMCEKYGLKYVPEVFPTQWYMNLVTLPSQVEEPRDLQPISCHGAPEGIGASQCNINALHPLVQQAWIDGVGELADKLRDSPAFAGVNVRTDVWYFRGDFILPSINWGYGDWTIRQFEQDTGITVPGGPSDPVVRGEKKHDSKRFLKRFEFLTGSEMRERWINWRCERVADYHARLRDRIRGDRKDVYLALVGNYNSDAVYQQSDSIQQRALGCGVDLEKLRHTDGVAVIPVARYGSRATTSEQQEIYDGFFSKPLVEAGMADPRGFSASMIYHEWGTFWPGEKVGLNLKGKAPFYYCSAVLPAGRHSLEKYAVVLAQQDSAFLRDGGNADIYGDPAIWGPWFAEYKALPAVAFEPLAEARDPAAVWFKEHDGAFYFYAVNRERYPVTLTLKLSGADQLLRLGTHQDLPLTEGTLEMTLLPYELRSFRAASGAEILDAQTQVPADQVAYVRDRLAHGQNMLRQIQAEGSVDAAASQAFSDQLASAWAAYESGQLWRARVTLHASPMMRVAEKLGQLPPGQIVVRFPGLMLPIARGAHFDLIEPMMTPKDLHAALVQGSDARLRPSTEINAQWGGNEVLFTPKGSLCVELDVPVQGAYRISLGHIAPQQGAISGTVGGQALPKPVIVREAGSPETTAFSPVTLAGGKVRLQLEGDMAFGLYGLKLLPVLRAMPVQGWAIAGPFPSHWRPARKQSLVKQSLEQAFGPVADPSPNAVYRTTDGRELRWVLPSGNVPAKLDDRGVNMAIHAQSPGKDINFAKTYIHSDQDRTVLLYMAVDWWARAYLNGERLQTNIDPAVEDASGADFITYYPRYYSLMHLKEGINTLIVKLQGGRLGNGFAAYITDDPGVVNQPRP